MTRVEDNNDNGVVASNFGDIKTGQTVGNYTYHDDGSLRSDLKACPERSRREEIAYIDWYPSGKIKRIYRTATSEQSDLYFEYDPMGMRTLKVEMTRTGTTINPASGWKYTYYAADANGTTLAIYELDENDQYNTLKKTESMLYGGSRLGIDVEAVTVAGYSIDPLTKCNTDGRASFMLEVTGPLLGQPTQDIAIFLDGTLVGAMPNWGGGTGGVNDLIALINGSGAGVEATQLTGETVGSDYVALIEIKEIEPGTYPEGAAVTHTIGGTYVTITTEREFTIGECYSDRELGLKYYELSNHLGNVMEVVSDRKITVDDATFDALTGDLVTVSPDGIIDYFEADVVQYSDYYPFGFKMPNRNGSITEKYRYGFGGKEGDPEVSGEGNSYDFGARQYDSRLGRWMSRDPYESKYVALSPYSYVANQPIVAIDPNGKEIIIVGDDEYREKIMAILVELAMESSTARELIEYLVQTDAKVFIGSAAPYTDRELKKGLDNPTTQPWGDNQVNIFIDLDNGSTELTVDLGKERSKIKMLVEDAVIHELQHAKDHLMGVPNDAAWTGEYIYDETMDEYVTDAKGNLMKSYDLKTYEVRAVNVTNKIRAEMGYSKDQLRYFYGEVEVFDKQSGGHHQELEDVPKAERFDYDKAQSENVTMTKEEVMNWFLQENTMRYGVINTGNTKPSSGERIYINNEGTGKSSQYGEKKTTTLRKRNKDETYKPKF